MKNSYRFGLVLIRLQGIVRLDVYSIYSKNPDQLLCRESIASPISQMEVESISLAQSVSPLISTGLLDMANFQVFRIYAYVEHGRRSCRRLEKRSVNVTIIHPTRTYSLIH